MSKKSRIDEKIINFNKKLDVKARIKAVYTEKVVPSGTSARINCKSEFLKHPVLVIIFPKKEEILYSKK